MGPRLPADSPRRRKVVELTQVAVQGSSPDATLTPQSRHV
jgi:hypothetical protein